jgi:nitronate monooxygenase
MALPPVLKNLRLPVIAAPMFIAGNPTLVIEQCKAGIVGSFPALNARPKEALDDWLAQIEAALDAARKANPAAPPAPFAVNQIVHKSNDRLEHDLETCVRHKVPITITSLRAPNEVVQAVHGYGGIVLHDVINVRHAQKALEAGVDGLILVCTGAGGHAGRLSPFAMIGEVRRFFDGPIATGDAVLAAQAAGADLAYIGTRFLATPEASVPERYKDEILKASANDIIYTDLFSGVHGNYLRHSVVAAGYDPENLPKSDPSKMNFGTEGGAEKKVWRDIWSAGQGVGQIDAVMPVAEVVAKLATEYAAARRRLAL